MKTHSSNQEMKSNECVLGKARRGSLILKVRRLELG